MENTNEFNREHNSNYVNKLKETLHIKNDWWDAKKEKPGKSKGYKFLSPKVEVKTPLGEGRGYYNYADNDWLIELYGSVDDELQAYKDVTHWRFIDNKLSLPAIIAKYFNTPPDGITYNKIVAIVEEYTILNLHPIKQEIDTNTPFFGNSGAKIPVQQSQTVEEMIDLQQYVTNLLYYAHIEARVMDSKEFDKWVEREVNNIAKYASQKHPIVTDEGKSAEEIEEKVTNAFCETRDEDIKNNLQYRDRDYFQAGYDFASQFKQKELPTEKEIKIAAMKEEGIEDKYFEGIHYSNDWTDGVKWCID